MKKKILIVDDEEEIVSSLKAAFEMVGYEIECAKDGQEAIDKIRIGVKEGNLFDLILTDVLMPNKSGLDLLDMLNDDKLLIPVIAMTGYPDKKMMMKLILKGCDDSICKPFEPEKLLERVKKILAKARATE